MTTRNINAVAMENRSVKMTIESPLESRIGMNRLIVRSIVPLCLALAILWLSAPLVSAKKTYLKKIAANYKLDDMLAKCSICHDSGEDKPNKRNLNLFGREFRDTKARGYDVTKMPIDPNSDVILQAFESLADKDTDGDGATNLEEIMLGTNPGNAKSKPDPDKLAEYRKTHPKK